MVAYATRRRAGRARPGPAGALVRAPVSSRLSSIVSEWKGIVSAPVSSRSEIGPGVRRWLTSAGRVLHGRPVDQEDLGELETKLYFDLDGSRDPYVRFVILLVLSVVIASGGSWRTPQPPSSVP